MAIKAEQLTANIFSNAITYTTSLKSQAQLHEIKFKIIEKFKL
jgi:hypothetical protein